MTAAPECFLRRGSFLHALTYKGEIKRSERKKSKADCAGRNSCTQLVDAVFTDTGLTEYGRNEERCGV